MPYYRVRPGFTFGKSKQFKAGDTISLTEEEYEGFKDKLEPVSGKAAPAAVKSEPAVITDDTSLFVALPEKLAQKFVDAGVTSVGQAKSMSDEELMGLSGVGDASVKQLREALEEAE